MAPIITEIYTMDAFSRLLEENPGRLFIKLGSTTCAPCKRIEKQVYQWYDKLPQNKCQCVLLDIDISHAFYTFMKSKKMVRGVPTLFCYKAGNNTIYPDDIVIGANPPEIDAFFNRMMVGL